MALSILVLALLCAIFAQAGGSASGTSLTIDEGLHLTSGYTILCTGDYRLVEEHPPLVKMWAALPLLPVPDLADPRTLPPWGEAAEPTTESLPLLQMTQQWLYPYRPVERLVVPARAMVALLAVLLGAVVFRWAKDLWGWRGGLLALFLLAFDPNILAHAGVAGTDLGAACFITLALFCLARFLRRPSLPRLVLTGVTLGLAQGAKLSALMLLPVVIMLGVLALPQRWLLSLLLLFVIAGLVLWGLYGFEVGSIPGVPFPVPAASHRIPWLRLRQHIAGGHAAFLMGENRSHGWWYYFPVAFLLKTPLPTLLLLLAAIVAFLKSVRDGIRSKSPSRGGLTRLILTRDTLTSPATPSETRAGSLGTKWHHFLLNESALLLFPLLYGASSLFSPLNIGYRHLLPILPFLFIFISRNTQHASRFTHYALRTAALALLLWQAFATLRLFPHYLAYFNELAGGPDGGYRYLADSNTDWGQAYKDLAHFQRERGLGPVRLSAFIFYDPAIYGVEYEPLTPLRGDTPAVFPSRFAPPPGDYVISATTLDGIPLVDPEMYDWFRKREPDAKIAHVLFYYHVPERDPAPAWLAQCALPVIPFPPQVAAEGFGRDVDGLRMAYFDCTQAWLYPDGGRSAGWYAFYRGEETEGDFVQAHRAPARLAYEQRMGHDTPPFVVYEWPPVDTEELMSGVQTDPVIVAPSDWAPERAKADGVTLSPPLSFSGPLVFLGYRLEAGAMTPGETLALWTYWSATDTPDRPLSLIAHLLDGEGRPVAVGDGLGVPVTDWRGGDLLIQRHLLLVPEPLSPGTYWLQTGAYWLDTMERWEVEGEDKTAGDRVLLTSLEVP
ncbi:MAG: ArnT family glycosyltransferase [Anaerolineae bacterium]